MFHAMWVGAWLGAVLKMVKNKDNQTKTSWLTFNSKPMKTNRTNQTKQTMIPARGPQTKKSF